jgi:predicted transposase/invertase (TIGR01784 family)
MKSKSKSKSATPTLSRFDWAMKRLLRQKANYTVLEGFLSVLLDEKVKIINIKESESNKASVSDKFNRVDILVENNHGELLIVELQNSDESDYFLRMLYGVSKVISEHILEGEPYSKVRKVYHINIVYFKLGQGKDYVYYGFTEFRGIHCHDVLQLTDEQKEFFAGENRKNVKDVKDLYPEYYILCIEDFNNVAKSGLDEWIYYFKNNDIPDGFTAPGLEEVKKRLQYDKLSEQEKRDYNHHLKQSLYERGSIKTAIRKGEAKGRAKGLAEGEAKGRVKGRAEGLAEGEAKGRAAERTEVQENIIINSFKAGYSVESISAITGITPEKIIEILKLHGLI